jgi:hypothetical protein
MYWKIFARIVVVIFRKDLQERNKNKDDFYNTMAPYIYLKDQSEKNYD